MVSRVLYCGWVCFRDHSNRRGASFTLSLPYSFPRTLTLISGPCSRPLRGHTSFSHGKCDARPPETLYISPSSKIWGNPHAPRRPDRPDEPGFSKLAELQYLGDKLLATLAANTATRFVSVGTPVNTFDVELRFGESTESRRAKYPDCHTQAGEIDMHVLSRLALVV